MLPCANLYASIIALLMQGSSNTCADGYIIETVFTYPR